MHYRIEQSNNDEFNPGVHAQWLDAQDEGLKKRLGSD